MPSRAETLFERLQDRDALASLIGQAEDADFDCKQWFANADMRFPIAKAACGFSNATGGVIIVGLRAEGRNGDPDLVKELKPVDDMGAVKASALDIILKFVKPGIEGVRVELVPDSFGSTRGYVLIFIPEGEGSPQRCEAKPKDFFVRIASGTVPMEYFQIEDRFGRRPRARLSIAVSPPQVKGQPLSDVAERLVIISLTNGGRGIARFPALRVTIGSSFFPAMNPYGIDAPIWSQLTNEGWHSFRGGADNLIYPGESLAIAKLTQQGSRRIAPPQGVIGPYAHMALMQDWDFSEAKIRVQAVCDGTPLLTRDFAIPAFSYIGRQGTS